MMPVPAWRHSLSLPPSTPLGYRDRTSPGRWMEDAHARQTAQQGPGQARKVRNLVCWLGSLQHPAGGGWELANTPGTWQWQWCGRYLGCVLCSDSSCPPGAPGCSAAYGDALRKPVGRALIPRIRERLPERKGNACWV